MVGFVLGTLGYPFCLTLSTSIFSKITMQYRAPVSGTKYFPVFETNDNVFIQRPLGWEILQPPAPLPVWLDLC